MYLFSGFSPPSTAWIMSTFLFQPTKKKSTKFDFAKLHKNARFF